MRPTSLARGVVVVSLIFLGATQGLAQTPPGGGGGAPAQLARQVRIQVR